MIRHFHFMVAGLASVGFLSACGTVSTEVREDVTQRQKRSEQTFSRPVQRSPRVRG